MIRLTPAAAGMAGDGGSKVLMAMAEERQARETDDLTKAYRGGAGEMTDGALTNEEIATLRKAGYEPCGGSMRGGIIRPRFQKDGEAVVRTRAEWRAVIAGLNNPLTEDEAAFGRDAWIYCLQHQRPHLTGWCSVSPRDKVGLGVTTADEAYRKCREWGFALCADRDQSHGPVSWGDGDERL